MQDACWPYLKKEQHNKSTHDPGFEFIGDLAKYLKVAAQIRTPL